MPMRSVCVAISFICLLALKLTAGQPRWQQVGQLTQPSAQHGSVMLADGAVFVVGGVSAGGTVTAATHLLDPATGLVRALAPLPEARAASAVVAVHRADGTDIYVIGGYTGTSASAASSGRVDRFRYFTATRDGQWSTLGSLDRSVGDCRAVFDGGNAIIVTGGRQQTTGAMGSGTPSNGSWQINTSTGAIQRLPDLTLPHAAHAALRYIDQLGRNAVLAAGGEQPPPTSVTELLINGVWDARANAPRQWRSYGASTTDRGDIARVFGGFDPAGQPTAETEWYDPKSGWRAAPRMTSPRARHVASNVAGPADTASAVIVVGGVGTGGPQASTELFTLPGASDPVGGWELLPSLASPVQDAAVALSAWNLPVVSGGTGTTPIALVQMLQPLQAPDIVMPSTEVSALSDSVFLGVTNTWVLPVTIDTVFVGGSSEFLVLGAVSGGERLGAGSTKRYRVYFRPSAEGLREGFIVFRIGPVEDTVRVSGIGLRSTVAVTTSAIDLGDVIVGDRKDTCLPLIINQGADTLRIDSLVLTDPTVTVISPLGRFKVAPGDTMTVCLRYVPTQRTTLGATMTAHVGAKQLPIAVIGRGIRRYIVVGTRTDCDTITAVPGDVVSVVAIITNPSDRTVTVTDLTVTSTTQGTVVLDPSVTFPFDVAPNATVPIQLRQTVVREGREDITVRSTDNGDTLARGTVCTVPRSRTIQLSTSVIDLGRVCAGASVSTTLTLENISSVETIRIDSAVVLGMVGSTDLPSPTTLQPRSSVTVRIDLVVPTTGPLDGRISFDGPNGSTVALVTGTIAPSVEVSVQDAQMAIGTVGRQAVRATPNTTQNVSLALTYPWKLLSARTATAGDVPTTVLTSTPSADGSIAVEAQFARQPNDGEVLFYVEYDVLRADALVASVQTAPTTAAPCVVSDTGTVEIDPFCGASNGYVYLSDQPTMIAQRADHGVVLRWLNVSVNGTLQLSSLEGASIRTEHVDANVHSVDLHDQRGVIAATYHGVDGTVLRAIILQP